jgi:hypothetical protein
MSRIRALPESRSNFGREIPLINVFGSSPPPPSLLVIQSSSQQVILTQGQVEAILTDTNTRVTLFTVTGANIGQLEAVLDSFSGTDVIFNLTSQQMIDVGLGLVANPKYARKNFINCVSTVASVRSPTLPNLYFALESDNFFLPQMWLRFRGSIASVQFLIIEDDTNVFLQTVADSAPGYVTVYTSSQLADPAVIAALETATSIFICALNPTVQQAIADAIPEGFRGVAVFIDVGPYTQDVVNTLGQSQIIATVSQCTSLAFLPGSSAWNQQTKPAFTNSSPPFILGMYSLIIGTGQWADRYLSPEIVIKEAFVMNVSNFTFNSPSA